VEPESSADKQKLIDTLNILKREDPTFEWQVSADTGQTLMSGMGTLHLEIKRYKLEHDFRLKVRVYPPRVSYRETVRKPVRMEGECVKPATAGGLFAKVAVRLEPYQGKQSVLVTNQVPEEVLPAVLAAAAEQGVRGALTSGELGYPVINVQAAIVDAKVDPALSNDVAFQAAAADAVNQALKDNIVLLWPVMHLEVTVPEEYFGPVTSDLNARRAEIDRVIPRGRLQVIEATVPLAKMFDCSERVRSLTQGRASWTMEPRHYAPAPDEVRRGLLGLDDQSG
jgi:elongation factor G